MATAMVAAAKATFVGRMVLTNIMSTSINSLMKERWARLPLVSAIIVKTLGPLPRRGICKYLQDVSSCTG